MSTLESLESFGNNFLPMACITIAVVIALWSVTTKQPHKKIPVAVLIIIFVVLSIVLSII